MTVMLRRDGDNKNMDLGEAVYFLSCLPTTPAEVPPVQKESYSMAMTLANGSIMFATPRTHNERHNGKLNELGHYSKVIGAKRRGLNE